MSTDTDSNDNELEIETVDPDADDDTDEIECPEMHYLTLTEESQRKIKGNKRHLFVKDDDGGYSAICGNKSSPKYLKGKNIVPMHYTEILLDDTDLCKACQRKTGVQMNLLDLDALQEFAKQDYNSRIVVDRDEVQAALRDDRIPVRLSADLEIEMPRSSEDTLLHILSKVPGLLDRVQNVDENKSIVIENVVEDDDNDEDE